MKLFLFLAPILLAACSLPEPAPPKPLEWATLPDGSKASVGDISVPQDQFFDGPSAVMRCWPKDGGHDCLIGTRTSYSFMGFRRVTTPTLPQQHQSNLDNSAGYKCVASTPAGWQESIRSDAGEIKLNVVSIYELAQPKRRQPNSWSKSDVEKIFKDNGIIPKSQWVNCKNISRVVGTTTLAAVASTELTQALIDAED